MSYPETDTFEGGGSYPAGHPVHTAQVLYEVMWDTKKSNNEEWLVDGSNPFM